ncbi:tetratricopeptide repeat protein [Plantactinospora sp. S1510]|uniref:Tetratricopeptide repeat protein n=1 Tax=Plantactinospora alkalitolerans TaxID=2789879 RepID=A0ABS0HA88_9ACTN|nr:tetratricopeptide repeat protein [Plantactinospora alkalitolerans]MBF9135166.1 tetratricopeptide repeat protein [Plantactinospora alkalitolerans]
MPNNTDDLGMIEAALRHAESTSDMINVVNMSTTLGNALVRAGRTGDARPHYQRSAELAQQYGLIGAESVAREQLGICLARLGDFAGADAQFAAAITVAGQLDSPKTRESRLAQLAKNRSHAQEMAS